MGRNRDGGGHPAMTTRSSQYSIVSFQDEAGNNFRKESYCFNRIWRIRIHRIPSFIDTISPVITQCDLRVFPNQTSGMYLNQKRAEPGDTITLTIEANEPLDYLGRRIVSMSGTRVSISSVTESSKNEGRTWVATGTVVFQPAMTTRSSHTA